MQNLLRRRPSDIPIVSDANLLRLLIDNNFEVRKVAYLLGCKNHTVYVGFHMMMVLHENQHGDIISLFNYVRVKGRKRMVAFREHRNLMEQLYDRLLDCKYKVDSAKIIAYTNRIKELKAIIESANSEIAILDNERTQLERNIEFVPSTRGAERSTARSSASR